MTAIDEVLAILEDRGFRLEEADALEVFGGNGTWQTAAYAERVATLEVWEIDPALVVALRDRFPRATVRNLDSFQAVSRCERTYDLIVVDNPQGVYGDGKYTEHFELFPDLFALVPASAVVILDVNHAPYDFHPGSTWWERRREFYGTATPDHLTREEVRDAYAKRAEAGGFDVSWSFFVPRNAFIDYFVLRLQRTRTPGS